MVCRYCSACAMMLLVVSCALAQSPAEIHLGDIVTLAPADDVDTLQLTRTRYVTEQRTRVVPIIERLVLLIITFIPEGA